MGWLQIQEICAIVAGGLFLVILIAGIFTADRFTPGVGRALNLGASALLAIVGFCLMGLAVGGESAKLGLPVQLFLQLSVGAIIFWVFRMLWKALIHRTELSVAPSETPVSPPPAADAPLHTPSVPGPAFSNSARRNDPRSPEVAQRCQQLVTELSEDHPEVVELADDFNRLINLSMEDRAGETHSIETILNDLRASGDFRTLLDTLQQDMAGLKAREIPPLDKIADRAREISELAFASGEIWAAEAALDELLMLNPADLKTLNRKGHTRALRGDLSGAAAAYGKLIQLAREKHDEAHLAMAYGNLGSIHESLGDLDNAEKMHRLSLELEVKNNNPEGMAADYGNLGKIFQSRGDAARAEEHYRKALEIALQCESLEGEAAQYANLGTLYIEEGDLEQAEMMLRHALIIEERLGNREGMADNYANLGLVHVAHGNLEMAAEAFHRALYLEDKLDRSDRRGFAYMNLGQIFLDRNDTPSARRYWTQALDCFARIPLPERVDQVQNWLMELSIEA